VKYILFWTDYLKDENWGFKKDTSNHEDLKKMGCKETNCVFTSNRSLLPVEEFDAILFYIRFAIRELPEKRSAKQIYVAANDEPAMFTGFYLKFLEGVFNWTS
jgi:hypothetical protein